MFGGFDSATSRGYFSRGETGLTGLEGRRLVNYSRRAAFVSFCPRSLPLPLPLQREASAHPPTQSASSHPAGPANHPYSPALVARQSQSSYTWARARARQVHRSASQPAIHSDQHPSLPPQHLDIIPRLLLIVDNRSLVLFDSSVYDHHLPHLRHSATAPHRFPSVTICDLSTTLLPHSSVSLGPVPSN